uniref:LisH domain-containing protein C1711.05-like isoform X4 n=1 Tax=Dermatophagoides pteronyssinus TaxID=6956 RepID=A0A6P6YD66_DERPT|nr:lisH domain-containing protein C1711.05-like isoform X4 [Dermatophagoides pteronyssinus]
MVFKRQFFEYLSMMIGVIMNEVWMTNGDKSFIMRGIEGKTEWDMVRYPYKTVYGLPKSLQCSESVYHQFNKCEKSSHRKWKVTIDEYFYETKQFCCFVWHTMACEIEIAAKCNRNYSQQIKTNTRQLFTSVCDKISSSQGSWNCWWTEEMIIIIGVAATVITILLIAVGAYFGCRQYRANAKLKAQGKLAEQMNVPLKTTTADTGAPTNVKTLQSNEIPTTADSIDKPIQNVEKQGTVKKWFSNLFSTSKKPELTAKDIGPPTDVKKNDVPIHDILEPRPPEHRTFIPSSAQQQSTMINMNNEKPVEISIVETPVPAKIDTLHLQKPPKDKETDKKLSNLFGRLSLSDSRQSSPTSSPPADKRAKYEPSTSKYEPSSSKSPFSSKKDSSSSPFASSSKYGQSSSKYESSSFSTYREPPKYESASSSSSSSSPFSSKKDSSSSSSSPSRFEYSSSPSRYSTSSSSPTQSRYEHSLPQPDKNKQFFRKFTAYKNYETPSSSDSSPSASPYVGRKKKRSIPLETTTTDNQSQPSQQPSQSDQATINLVKDPTNTNKNLTNLTNIIVNLDKINIDPNVKMP